MSDIAPERLLLPDVQAVIVAERATQSDLSAYLQALKEGYQRSGLHDKLVSFAGIIAVDEADRESRRVDCFRNGMLLCVRVAEVAVNPVFARQVVAEAEKVGRNRSFHVSGHARSYVAESVMEFGYHGLESVDPNVQLLADPSLMLRDNSTLRQFMECGFGVMLGTAHGVLGRHAAELEQMQDLALALDQGIGGDWDDALRQEMF